MFGTLELASSQWRRRTASAAVALLVVAPWSALAQPAPRTWRIGAISTRTRPPNIEADYLGAWIPKLRDLGYLEGKNLVIEWRFAEGVNSRLPAMAADLVRLNCDVVVAAGTPSALAMQKASSTIPIVVAGVADPVGFGMVASLSKPGGNVTGTAIMATDVSVKSLEFLLAFVPALRLVAVLLNPNNPIDPVTLKQVHAAAMPSGVSVAAFEARSAAEIDVAFAAIARSRAEALIVAPDPVLVNQARQITELAAKGRLPAIYPFRPFVEVGGLMCYGQNIYENFGRAASYIDRIFRGAKPGELPVEQPTQLELVVNRKAAEAIGLKVPLPILLRANMVID